MSEFGTDERKRRLVLSAVPVQTKRDADELATGPAFKFLATGVLHGDMSQNARDSTLENFKRGKFRVLVATDVAARGIDISGIDLVLQYQMPQNSDSYVHRAGRTGRAGKTGVSIVLHTERDERALRSLEFQARCTSLPLPSLTHSFTHTLFLTLRPLRALTSLLTCLVPWYPLAPSEPSPLFIDLLGVTLLRSETASSSSVIPRQLRCRSCKPPRERP